MSITHHPGEELLLSYASGAADEAVALLVASHLTMCLACRVAVRAAEMAGGSMLSSIPPAVMGDRAYQAVLGRLGEPEARVLRDANLNSKVPAPLQPYVGSDYDAMPWRSITRGLAHLPLATKGGTRARLIRSDPGVEVAPHTHRGEEWTLVLVGSFSDNTGNYEPGDVQSNTPEIEHCPKTNPGPACINLAVTDAPLVFRGLIPKLAGWFFGF